MTEKAVIMEESAVIRALTRISHEILEKNKGARDVCLVGIRSRGSALAKVIADNISHFEGLTVPCGDIDICHYRDDRLGRSGRLGRLDKNSSCEADMPVLKKAELPFSIADKKVILVDDVLYTGRTARAAIEAIFSLGRPSAIQFAILVDRGHRELPIRADYVGKNIPTARTELISVHIPPFDKDTSVLLYEK